MEDTARLPVFRAFAATWALLGERLVDVIKIVWLPSVISTAAAIAATNGMTNALADAILASGDDADPAAVLSANGRLLSYAIPITILSVICNIIAAAGLLKLVIRGETPATPFYIGFGRDELNLLGGALMIFGIMFAVGIGAGVLGAVAGLIFGSLPAVGGLVTFAIGCVIVGAFVWILAKTSLASPAAISLKRIGVTPSWTATGGQVWLVIGFWLLWVLVAIVAQMILGAFMRAPEPDMAPPTTPDGIREYQAAAVRAAADMYNFSDSMAFVRAGLALLQTIATTALSVIAAGVAWRFMTDDSKPAPASTLVTP